MLPVVVLDDNNTVSVGSRAVCYAKRSLEVWNRLDGLGAEFAAQGVQWKIGKTFFRDELAYQFDLLLVMAERAGRVLSRDQIMDQLKGHPLEAFDRSIDVHISRIRAAIEDDPKTPKRILTVRGVGYVFAKQQD